VVKTLDQLKRSVITGWGDRAARGAMYGAYQMSRNPDVSQAEQPAMVQDYAKRIGTKSPELLRDVPVAAYHPFGHPAEVERKLNRGSFFPVKAKPSVSFPDSATEAEIAHELGHTKNYETLGPRAGLAVNATRALGGLTRGPALAYSAMAEDPSYIPGLLHAGLNAPTLVDEAMASGRGLKALIGKHGLGGGLRQGMPLLPAFGTYALQAGAPLAVTGIRKALRARSEAADATEAPSLGKEASALPALLLEQLDARLR